MSGPAGMRPVAGDPFPRVSHLLERAAYQAIAARSDAIDALVAANAITLLFVSEPAPRAARVVDRAARAATDLSAGGGRLRELAGTLMPQEASRPAGAGAG